MKKLLLTVGCLLFLSSRTAIGANTLPSVASWLPVTNSSNIGEMAQHTVTLNSPIAIDCTSATATNVYLASTSCSGTKFGSVGAPVCTSATPQSTISITPTASLASGATYYFCVKSIKNTSNEIMSGTASATFTVRDYMAPYMALTGYIPIATTSNTNTDPAKPLIISAPFSEAMNAGSATVSGANPTINLINVTDGNIAVTLNPPTWSGNTVSVVPSGALAPLKTYQVILTSGLTDTSGNALDCVGHSCTWMFNVDNQPVTLLSSLPIININGYVNTVPTVITATFSDAINATTLTTTTFIVEKYTTITQKTAVNGARSFDIGSNTATFTPSVAFTDGTYKITLTNGIKDSASPTPNALAPPQPWTFILDTVAPAVASTSPANNATEIPITSPITIIFTELNNMLASSMNSATVSISDGSQTIPASISYDSTAKKVTLTPATGLDYSMTYTVTLTSGVTDLAGNPLSQYIFSFTTQAASLNTYTVVPPYVCTNVKPNVLIILDNSNSMDEDFQNNAIGSPKCTDPSDLNTCSRSIVARQALTSIVNAYSNIMRIGIMSYKLPAVSKYYLHNSVYFNSFDLKSYCPNPPADGSCYDYCVKEDPKTGAYTPSATEVACRDGCQNGVLGVSAGNPAFQVNYRDAITTTGGTSGSNGTAVNSAKRKTYCSLIYPKTHKNTDTNGTTTYYGMPGTFYDGSNHGISYTYSSGYSSTEYPAQTDSYYTCTSKTGANDATTGFAGCTGPLGFTPTDDDYALGFYDFGIRNSWYYTSQTFFANSSPGGGYLNVPIADNVSPGNTQLNSLLTSLGGNRTPVAFQNDETGYMSCANTSNPNACSYIINAGLTPTAGTLQSAINYFKGTMVQGNTLTSPIQYSCQKNFIIYVTDGAPSVTESGATGASTDLMPTVLTKLDALRCPPNGGSGNCNVVVNSINYDVTSYVLGVGLVAADKANVDAMAVHGGTDRNGQAYYADNPTQLNNSLIDIFNNILNQLSSGTAASILSNAEGSGAVILQAIFYPKKVFSSNTVANWTGELLNFWYYLDPFINTSSIREDTDYTDATGAATHNLNLVNDYIVNFFFDTSMKATRVKLFQDTNGDGIGETLIRTDYPENVKSLWKAGSLLWACDQTKDKMKRFLYTSTSGTSLRTFDSSVATATDLQQYLQASDVTNAQQLINYISGIDYPGDATMRNRTVTIGSTSGVWKLGDIVTSTPRVVSTVPQNNYHLQPPSGYNDSSYYSFINSNEYKARGSVFVGANDGMLHAFNLGLLDVTASSTQKATLSGSNMGSEQWAYIPRNVLPYLKYLADPSYGHLNFVDLTSTIADVSIGTVGTCTHYWDCSKTSSQVVGSSAKDPVKPNDLSVETNWRTVLIGGMGLGGASRRSSAGCTNCVRTPIVDPANNSVSIGYSSYFALDITKPEAPALLWEFTNNRLGYSTAGPAIIRVGPRDKNGRWLALFASGPTGPIDTTTHQFLAKSDQPLRLFIVDIKDGSLVQTINTGILNAFAGSLQGGALDADRWNLSLGGNYQDDAVYIGYVKQNTSDNTWTDGGVLRVMIKPSTADPATIQTGTFNVSSNDFVTSIVIDGIGPVTSSIARLQDRKNKNFWLYFGTGRYYFKTTAAGDLDDCATQRKIIGIKEPCYTSANAIDTTCSTTVDPTKLTNQSGVGYTTAATNSLDILKDKGWFITLDAAAGSSCAERVITNPVALSTGAVFFTTFLPSSDICAYGGNSYLWALKYDTGFMPASASLYGKAIIQMSTGSFEESKFNDPSNPASTPFTARESRRTGTAMQGKPPADPPTIINRSQNQPVKKILHIQER